MKPIVTMYAHYLLFASLWRVLSPAQWRACTAELLQRDDKSLRLSGLINVLLGFALFFVTRYLGE